MSWKYRDMQIIVYIDSKGYRNFWGYCGRFLDFQNKLVVKNKESVNNNGLNKMQSKGEYIKINGK